MRDPEISAILDDAGFGLSRSQRFHRDTKISQALRTLDRSQWPLEWKEVSHKAYPRLPAFRLPKPNLSKALSLKAALSDRRSRRSYSSKALTLQQVSSLLFYSAGIRKRDVGQPDDRFYPSAGARYPLEIYPIVLNVAGSDEGIYHYYAKDHALEVLEKTDTIRHELAMCHEADWMGTAALIIAISSVFYRSQVKYGDRAYRYMLMEAGHLSQNLYLISSALQINCCSVGGFADDAYNSLVDLDGTEEAIIAVMLFGQPNTDALDNGDFVLEG